MIDDFRIYNYALSQSQMLALVPRIWTGTAGSNWTTATVSSPKNWQVLGSATDYSAGDVVIFDDTASNFTVNITDASVSPGSIEFDNSTHNYIVNGPASITGSTSLTKNGTGSLTINSNNTYIGGTNLNGGTLIFSALSNLGTGPIMVNGGTLQYAGTTNTADLTANGLTINSAGATINTGSNTVTFASAITGGGPLIKTGTGSLTLDAAQSLGTLTISGGTLHLAAADNAIAGTVAINGSSTFEVDGNTTAAKLQGDGTDTLEITAGKLAATAQNQSTLSLAAVSIAPNSVLDLGNGNLAINYGTGPDPYSTIATYLTNGYDHGKWDGHHCRGQRFNHRRRIRRPSGQAARLRRQHCGFHQVQVKYAWYGDLNLDGVVNSIDLGMMASKQLGWSGGDLNYDGVVNADDWSLFFYGNASQNGSISSAGVPEPATGLLFAPLAAALGLWRKR